MKIVKYTLLSLLGLLFLGAASIALLLRAPSSAEVCANQLRLVEAELSERGLPTSPALIKELIGSTPDRCEHDLEFRRHNSSRARIKLAAELRCLAAAGSLTELEACR